MNESCPLRAPLVCAKYQVTPYYILGLLAILLREWSRTDLPFETPYYKD